MAGYYNMPEKTAETIDADGWLHTGDLATMDEQGYVNIVGRLKEMVIRGGENIFPREIEELLIRHPKVADAQVLGVPMPSSARNCWRWCCPKKARSSASRNCATTAKSPISHQKIPRYYPVREVLSHDGQWQSAEIRAARAGHRNPGTAKRWQKRRRRSFAQLLGTSLPNRSPM